MNLEERNHLIQYRFQKAQEALDDALLLKENKRWNASINRLYYCCFYSSSAVLLKLQVEANTHKGLKSQFNEHLVKTGLFDKSNAILLSNLFNWRQKGDYDDMFDISEEIVENAIGEVAMFLKTCEQFLSKN